ncbi:hypothetical protein SISNIDRAFT_488838 [Sistotremastrum niveocremeum HHB9708]|uniref:Mid2 domain-containing protein n=1 Tax=Sistotremastrum niveocremeum HHB9708 TaxID=1314777 RepID=A0A164QUI2_9AGAM|nr:hypothetical protein SISNIDRAFT_488838 [Sistotremastrum niveocremeum HHB9708]
MACTPSPTETLFSTEVVTSQSTQSSTTTTVTTISGTTAVSTQTTCLVSIVSNLPCSSEGLITVTSTAPDTVSTITNQVVVTVPVTLTNSVPTQTLFSTCPSQGPSQPPPNGNTITTPDPVTTPPTSPANPPPTTTPDTTSLATTSSPGLSASLSTPDPSTITSASSMTIDGQVTVQFVTITSTPPASTFFVSPSSSPTLNMDNGPTGSSSSSNVAPIAGGVVGGFLGLFAIVGVIWFFLRRRRKAWDDIFEREKRYDLNDDELPANVEPAPYRYGLVGGSHSHSPSLTPPASPTMRNSGLDRQSRAASFAGASVHSRDSMSPQLIGLDSVPGLSPNTSSSSQPWRQGRTPSGASDMPLLAVRPSSHSGPSSPSGGEQSTVPTSPGSPHSIRQPPSAYYLANATDADTQVSRSRHASMSSPVASGSEITMIPLKDRRRRASAPMPQDVIVHTDGGRLAAGSPRPTSPRPGPSEASELVDAPPAYSKR